MFMVFTWAGPILPTLGSWHLPTSRARMPRRETVYFIMMSHRLSTLTHILNENETAYDF